MWQQHRLTIDVRDRGFTELTDRIQKLLAGTPFRVGLCHIFIRHTSASLCITENADPEVLRDLERCVQHLSPDGDPLFLHKQEGDDDMPAHVRSILVGSEFSIPISNGRLLLGTWQGIYLWEHRRLGHRREVVITLHGDT